MRVLCYINHFFGQNPFFEGKSSIPPGTDFTEMERKSVIRRSYVTEVIRQLNYIPGAEVKVCGIHGYSLVPLDIEFNHIKEKPLLLIYESLNHMVEFVDEYDYFINIEDDVSLPLDTFKNIVEFDSASLLNEIFLPNRLEETLDADPYCVDLKAIPGWTQQQKKYKDVAIRVAVNPHSALLILSREKLKYALRYVDVKFRKAFLYNELDSAFAYYHSPFCLYRSERLDFHYVKHLDNWLYSKGEQNYQGVWAYRLKSIRASDFVPPILVRIFSFLFRKNH